MKIRLDRIVKGCNFVAGIINHGKSNSQIFKTAAKRLAQLLVDEAEGKEDIVAEAEAIFGTKAI